MEFVFIENDIFKLCGPGTKAHLKRMTKKIVCKKLELNNSIYDAIYTLHGKALPLVYVFYEHELVIKMSENFRREYLISLESISDDLDSVYIKRNQGEYEKISLASDFNYENCEVLREIITTLKKEETI